ncbi:hypothetical protein BDV28DRAFT_152044 [Aspergillus coremiiformis]|uniref:Uncharacterized protein n=1 Tax=Aspergillus coremiiformis TaxID=138285 RepID=A0A5N6YWG0_9EURO|nr:hypothetical protein BDV28DRAFT_152044 [Aspergillus coremiiformis]
MAVCLRSSLVGSLQLKAPYIAFPSTPFTLGPSNRGYGSRHCADAAPFTLWDAESNDFRPAAPHETQWIVDTFCAESITYAWPQIFIETATPPSSVPLTVACVAASFIPVGSKPRFLSANTSYSNPRIADPIPAHLHLPKWERPSTEQCRLVLEALGCIVNIEAINFLAPIIIVELQYGDGKEYGRISLPGLVGGRTTIYHHSPRSFWDMQELARERLINPSEAIQDTINYPQSPLGTLCPGVRVESGLVSRDGRYMDDTMASTAGVLLRSAHEGPRLTVSNHAFLSAEDVYHPSSHAGVCVGEITERFEHLDVALVKLFPSLTFTNTKNFQAQIPNRLLRSSQTPNNVWCSLDGMATGLVFLRVAGVRIRPAKRPPGVQTPFLDFKADNIMDYIGPVGGPIREGVCGAPIVVDDGQDGGVVGFFQFGESNSSWALSPCLDDLIDRGWDLV